VIFGAWDVETGDKRTRIFSKDWRLKRTGQKNPSYDQSREHIRLIEEEGYRLMTFPMKHSAQDGDYWKGAAKIGDITPKLTVKTLTKDATSWYASNSAAAKSVTEELLTPEKYPEGARYTVTINAYERNPKARAACIAHHGCTCMVCGFNFAGVYGTIGDDFIHVHHVIPLGKIGEGYEIDPITDLTPFARIAT
jgi:5-methylcytosine-specific restriction protein A